MNFKEQLIKEGHSEQEIQMIATKLAMLLTSLYASLYCIAEMEPRKMKNNMKMRYMNLRNAILNFLKLTTAKTPKSDQEKLKDSVYDKVTAIAELLPVVTQVPNELLDNYIRDCKVLAQQAYNSHHKNKKL